MFLSFYRVAVLAFFLAAFFEYRRWRTVRVFRKVLLSSGVPSDEARTLSKGYPFSFGELFSAIRATPRPSSKRATMGYSI